MTVRSVPIEEPPLAASSTFEDLTSKTESEVGGISLIPGGLSEKEEQKLKLLDQARRYREVQVKQESYYKYCLGIFFKAICCWKAKDSQLISSSDLPLKSKS